MDCQVCQQPLPHESKHTGREMMLGMRERFNYYECPRCGCLQMHPVPPDLDRFYPVAYPAFHSLSHNGPSWSAGLRAFLHRQLTWHGLGRPNWIGRLRGLRARKPFLPESLFHQELDVTPVSSILDVGCGSGDFLLKLARLGFQNLTGTDLFAEPQNFPGLPKILCGRLEDVPGPFDLVMLHHSFEHMSEPRHTFATLAALLKPTGRLLIRIPLAGTYAWNHYGVDWVQLDPPRHLFLHTVQSMQRLADHAGLQLTHTLFDSTGFQFWGSELYRRDIPLLDPCAPWASRPNGPFTPEEMAGFEQQAEELNLRQDGDQAGFIFRRP